MKIKIIEPPDYSEWLSGPSLIAIKGDETPNNSYSLGTREYDWHQHARGQLFCVETGLIHVKTAHGSWILPPHRAGWMPPHTTHKVRLSGALTGWTLFILPSSCIDLPQNPCVIGISEVLRALAHRAASWSKVDTLSLDQERIAAVISDEICRAPHEALHLPMPKNTRLERIAKAILEAPESQRTLDEWASIGAMSARTLRRLIFAETGLNFSQWRQQAQLIHALEMLARNVSVTEISDRLGYASPSNFIAMFRKAFGDSPAHYFAKKI